jgi:adenine deaminase
MDLDARATVPALGAEYLPSPEQLVQLRRVAGGRATADLIVRGGKVLSVHTGEILERDVVIVGNHIAAVTPVGRFQATEELDARGLYVAPTFIDVHIHIEYTMLPPGELARVSIPRGTSAVLADPNCIANVLGAEAMDVVGQTGTPLRLFRQVSHKIPRSTELELGGAQISDEELIRRVRLPNAATLGESNPFDLDLGSARKQHAALSAGKRVTGHTARLGDEALWAYLAGGVSDDHNAVTPAEVLDRIRLGATLTVMAGSMNDNCETIFADLAALGPTALNHLTFCADDKHVEDLVEQGHIDHHVRQAIRMGVDPVLAIRMASLNAALYYRLDHVLGSITPSRLADMQLIEDLSEVRPRLVLLGGQVVAKDGQALFQNPDTLPDFTRNTIHLHPRLSAELFRVPTDNHVDEVWVQAMEMYDGYFKRAFHCALRVLDGNVVADPERDVLKIAVVDRHHATGATGIGFVRGFGLHRGALAATTNCETQNLVIIGTTDQDMADAARAIEQLGGGFVVVADGQTLASVPLPIAGIMSDQPAEVVVAQSRKANAAAFELGCRVRSPFMIMSFVGLAGVPDLGLTEKGLVETASHELMPVVLTMQAERVCCRCPGHAHAVHQLMDPRSAVGAV